MWKRNDTGIKYEDTKNENHAGFYSSTLLQNQMNFVNSQIYQDVKLTLDGGCQYIPNLLCKTNDLTLFNNLEQELKEKEKEIVNWSKHHKYENPDDLGTFDEIVKKLCNHFNVKPLHTRLNYYLPNDWKPFHHDSHAYSNNDKEDITIGVSFGSKRNLEFKHVDSELKFKFPQNNGDVFAFNNNVNKKFQHGVPKDFSCKGNRISIILWGKQIK